jgi:hypothetical protein
VDVLCEAALLSGSRAYFTMVTKPAWGHDLALRSWTAYGCSLCDLICNSHPYPDLQNSLIIIRTDYRQMVRSRVISLRRSMRGRKVWDWRLV